MAPITLTRPQRHVDLTRSKAAAGGHLDTSAIDLLQSRGGGGGGGGGNGEPPSRCCRPAAPHLSRAQQYRRLSLQHLHHLLRLRHRPDRQVSFPISIDIYHLHLGVGGRTDYSIYFFLRSQIPVGGQYPHLFGNYSLLVLRL